MWDVFPRSSSPGKGTERRSRLHHHAFPLHVCTFRASVLTTVGILHVVKVHGKSSLHIQHRNILIMMCVTNWSVLFRTPQATQPSAIVRKTASKTARKPKASTVGSSHGYFCSVWALMMDRDVKGNPFLQVTSVRMRGIVVLSHDRRGLGWILGRIS